MGKPLCLGMMMFTINVTAIGAVLTSIVTLLVAILGIFKYFNYRSRQDELRLVNSDFHSVVASLRSDASTERLAGAILLRRFYDEKTESGKGTPYLREALDVATAILRGQVTSDFQKLLADGLAFAPTLHGADLQKTNLQFAYLGSRKKGVESHEDLKIDLSNADFYRADLSRASLKGANAQGATFYQARLHNTVLKGADLTGADFYEADLMGAKFDGALLLNAKFAGARNIPPDIQGKLDESGKYQAGERFQPLRTSSRAVKARVFLSRPGFLDLQRQQLIASLVKNLEAGEFDVQTLERSDYPNFGVVGEVRRIMAGCAGAIITGFGEFRIQSGSWRPGTAEEKHLENLKVTTPWSQIEGGIAVALGVPMLLLRERDVSGGIFDIPPGEPGVYQLLEGEDWNSRAFLNLFSNWCSDVRERAASSSN